MLIEPNAHSDYKTQVAHYKTLAAFMGSKAWDTTLAPLANGWELSVRNPSDRVVKMHPRDILEASRILSAIIEIAHDLATASDRPTANALPVEVAPGDRRLR